MTQPTVEELLANPIVKAAFQAAWADSFADDEILRHEEGGLILMDPDHGRFIIRRELPGLRDELAFHQPDTGPQRILAMYHTHPTPPSLRGMPDPSDADRAIARDWKIPSFVISESAIFIIDADGNVTLGEWT